MRGGEYQYLEVRVESLQDFLGVRPDINPRLYKFSGWKVHRDPHIVRRRLVFIAVDQGLVKIENDCFCCGFF